MKQTKTITDTQRAKELRRLNGGAFGNVIGTREEVAFLGGLVPKAPAGKVRVHTTPDAPKVKPAWMG